MSIKPPMCKMCGHTHYGLDHVFEGKQPSHPLVDVPMLRKEPREVPRSVAPSKLKAMEAEIEALQGEVAMLKRKLAEKAVTKDVTKDNVTVTKALDNNVTVGKRGGRPPLGDKPMSKAERTRKWRQSKQG